MELMTVVVIISVIAAFAIPNYQRTVERAHRKDAETNLLAIYSANKIYFAEKSVYWPDPVGSGGLAEINTNLKLAIIPNGMTYTCYNSTPNDFKCTATRNGSTPYTITITEASPPALSCSPSSSCP